MPSAMAPTPVSPVAAARAALLIARLGRLLTVRLAVEVLLPVLATGSFCTDSVAVLAMTAVPVPELTVTPPTSTSALKTRSGRLPSPFTAPVNAQLILPLQDQPAAADAEVTLVNVTPAGKVSVIAMFPEGAIPPELRVARRV